MFTTVLIIIGCAIAITAAFLEWLRENKTSDKKGKINLFIMVTGITLASIVSVLQKFDSDESEKRLLEANKELQTKLDSSKNEIINRLAHYGFQYNESEKRIEKLVRDSSRVIKIINGELPTLAVLTDDNSIGLTSSEIENQILIHMKSQTAVAKHAMVLCSYAASREDTAIYYFGGNFKLADDRDYPKDRSLYTPLVIDDLKNCKTIIIWVRGTYQGVNKKNSTINEVIGFHVKKKIAFGFNGGIKTYFINWFKEKLPR